MVARAAFGRMSLITNGTPVSDATVPGPLAGREPRIDIVRGLSILIILVNHLTEVVEFRGLHGHMVPTPTRHGFSTAAELFVTLSGYMVGLVYLARPRPVRAIWRRAATLWGYNLALLGFVLMMARFMPVDELGFWRIDTFMVSPLAAFARFATLQEAPRLLDILQLYVSLMLVSPIAIVLLRRSPALLVMLSTLLYFATQVVIFRRLSAAPGTMVDGLLKLFSWQILFFVAMALGRVGAHERLFRWLSGRVGVFAGLAAMFVVAAIVKELQIRGALFQPDWMSYRYGLNPVRLAHAVMMLFLYASALALMGRWLHLWPLRLLGVVGRHSLNCFAAGVVLTYTLGVVWERTHGHYPEYYAFAALGVGLTILLGMLLDARRRGRMFQTPLMPRMVQRQPASTK